MRQDSPADSLKKRSLYKLVSNIAAIPLFFIMEAVLPRILGPALYGSYNFAANLFQQAIALLEMGSSTWLNTQLAKSPHEFKLLAFYARFSGILLLAITLLALLLAFTPGGSYLLPEVPRWIIFPAVLWACLTWLSRIIRSLNDAVGLTTKGECGRIAINVTSAIILLLLFLSGGLSIAGLFTQQCLTLAILCLVLCYPLRRQWSQRNWSLSYRQLSAYFRKAQAYCIPLAIIITCSTIAVAAERWLLQFFAGSLEQGYFSLALKASMGCFLFVSAVTPLVARDLAVAHGNNDPSLMQRILDEHAPVIYAVAAWFACFTSIEAEALIFLLGGEKFLPALAPVQLMALYAMHQVYAFIGSSVFHATEKTKVLQVPILLSLLLGFFCTWFFIAPKPLGGMELGATGLALKLVLIQFITVNCILLLCKKSISFRYLRNLAHQFFCPLSFLTLAFVSKYVSLSLQMGTSTNIVRFFLAGLLYCFLSFCTVYCLPSILGITRTAFSSHLNACKRKFQFLSNVNQTKK